MRAAEDNEPLEDVPDWERELVSTAREILAETGEYIQLPTKYDIDEYSIMEKFCTSLNRREIGDILYDLISGSGAFRRFKDAVYKYGVEDEWYKYRNNAIKEIAIEWCRQNNIEFED
jgi:NTP pyrophosphatase (non-canonical NTP hydrolase)